MKIIFPIAGRGSRFQIAADNNPEYKKPKPLINIQGKPMILWAMESLPFLDLPHRKATTKFTVSLSDIVFVVLEHHQKEHQIVDRLQRLLSNKVNFVLIPDVTRGAVETVIAAKRYLTDEDMIISDCDHFFNGNNLYQTILKKEKEVRGIIPVFPPPDGEVKWSYTLFDKDQNAIAVAEKDPELAKKGAYANIGAYYFSSGTEFISEAEEMIKTGEMYGPTGKQEFFVAPLYNRMLQKGKRVMAAVLPEVWGLGTPKDVDYFLANYNAAASSG
jgi:NDP-sugar pyrophosphorylase family protein